jgi:hypothetical protein
LDCLGKAEYGGVAERLRALSLAKGRVERVREMRLRGISTITEAQVFAPAYWARWNAKFATAPRDVMNVHRMWNNGLDDEALARGEERALSKALTFSGGDPVHCVKTSGPGIAIRGAKSIIPEPRTTHHLPPAKGTFLSCIQREEFYFALTPSPQMLVRPASSCYATRGRASISGTTSEGRSGEVTDGSTG